MPPSRLRSSQSPLRTGVGAMECSVQCTAHHLGSVERSTRPPEEFWLQETLAAASPHEGDVGSTSLAVKAKRIFVWCVFAAKEGTVPRMMIHKVIASDMTSYDRFLCTRVLCFFAGMPWMNEAVSSQACSARTSSSPTRLAT